jgi:hypothetical protein
MITLALLVLRIFFYLMGLLMSTAVGSFGLIGFMYQVYSLWLVGSFKAELQGDPENQNMEATYLRQSTGLYHFRKL